MGRKAILQAGIHVRLKAKNYAHIVTGQDADGKDVKVKINAEARGKILETVGKNLYKVEFFAGEKGIVVGTKVPSAQITIDREAHPEHAVSGPARSTTGPNTTSSAGLRASPSTSSNQRSGFTKPKEPSKKKKKPAIVYPTALEWIQTFEENPSKIHKNGYILKDENEANADTSQNQAAVANDEESPSSTGGENSGGNDDNAQDEANIVSGNEAGDKAGDEAGDEAGDGEGFDVDAKDLEEDNLPALADLADEILLEEAKRGKDFEMKKFRSWSQIEKLVELGYEVECKDGRKWKIVRDSEPDKDAQPDVEKEFIGLKGYKFDRLVHRELGDHHPLMDMFVSMWAGDWQKQLQNLNEFIHFHNKKLSKTDRKVQPVSEHEFWVFFGLMIVAGGLGRGGHELWKGQEATIPTGFEAAEKGFDAHKYMSFARHRQLRPFFARVFEDPKKKQEAWSEIRSAIDGFNAKRKAYVSASTLKVLDEIMCAWRPRKDKFGGLPHISFVARKPKPFGKHGHNYMHSC